MSKKCATLRDGVLMRVEGSVKAASGVRDGPLDGSGAVRGRVGVDVVEFPAASGGSNMEARRG